LEFFQVTNTAEKSQNISFDKSWQLRNEFPYLEINNFKNHKWILVFYKFGKRRTFQNNRKTFEWFRNEISIIMEWHHLQGNMKMFFTVEFILQKHRIIKLNYKFSFNCMDMFNKLSKKKDYDVILSRITKYLDSHFFLMHLVELEKLFN